MYSLKVNGKVLIQRMSLKMRDVRFKLHCLPCEKTLFCRHQGEYDVPEHQSL